MKKRTTNRRRSICRKENKNTFESIEIANVIYHVGDSVMIQCIDGSDIESGKLMEIALIKEIYTVKTKVFASVIWYLKAQPRLIGSDQQNDDIFKKEIMFDQHAHQDTINMDVLVPTSKVIVCSSIEEYLQKNQSKKIDDMSHNVYWCAHAYDQRTHTTALLPPGFIETKKTRTTCITMNTKKTRKRDSKAMINEALNDASKALMLSTVPNHLPCRKKEHDEIEAYMKQQITSYGQGSGLYISGMPGTGKTATVRQIAIELKRHVDRYRGKKKWNKQISELPDFDFLEINAMKLPTPQHLYTELAQTLLGQHIAPNTAVRKLVEYFSTKNDERKVIVLLVDELDFLLTLKQKVIYNLFDWPTKKEAKLVVIGIANTIDLPERLLPRVSSRLGTHRVVFTPYSRHQLTQIIKQRLVSTKVFSADAIRFCASAVAGVSGDCRTALQICRRAVEIAQKDVAQNGIAQLGQFGNHNAKRVKRYNNNKKCKAKCDWDDDYGEDSEEIVTLQHLRLAKDQFDLTNDIQIVSMCSIYEKLFLTAIVMWNTRSNDLTATTRTYKQKFDNFVQTSLGDSKMPNVHFRNMVDRLIDAGILKMCFDHNDGKEFTTLNVNMDEAVHALKENDVCAKILSTLQAV
eukprot:640345_1